MKRPAEPTNKGTEETTINQVAVAHCIICMQSTQAAGGNTAARPTHSAAAVISRDTGFLMDSSVFVCALL